MTKRTGVVTESATFTDPAGRALTHTGGGGTFDDGFNEGFSEGQGAGFSNGQYGYGELDYSSPTFRLKLSVRARPDPRPTRLQ